jgi:hypothetical protein
MQYSLVKSCLNLLCFIASPFCKKGQGGTDFHQVFSVPVLSLPVLHLNLRFQFYHLRIRVSKLERTFLGFPSLFISLVAKRDLQR